MALLRIALGAEADIASSKELDSAMTGLKGHIDKRMASAKPVRKVVVGSNGSVRPFGITTAFVVGSSARVAVGRLWIVRSCSVFDSAAPLTSASLIGSICIGDAASANPLDMRGEPFTTLPDGDTFNNSSIRVVANDSLYVAFANTAPSTVGWTMEVDEYDDCVIDAQRL